jgi:hypothetical protein
MSCKRYLIDWPLGSRQRDGLVLNPTPGCALERQIFEGVIELDKLIG